MTVTDNGRGVGYMAQILSLNLDSPSDKGKEIIKSLDLPPFIIETLRQFKYWSLRHNSSSGFLISISPPPPRRR